MSEVMSDIAYLSQEIGPRPAGTEEEHQAALFLADRFSNAAQVEAEIEEFSCSNQPGLAVAVLFGITAVFSLVGAFLEPIALVSFLLAVVCAVLLVLEVLGRPVFSRLFNHGTSQNVVARVEPLDSTAARHRKVIVVANYDSDCVRPELSGGLVGLLPVLQKVCICAAILLVLVWLIRLIAGPGLGFTVVLVVLGVLSLLPVIQLVLHRTSAYNEAANCNASGAAALVELARMVQESAWTMPDVTTAMDPIVHGEAAAREAGVVPEGAQLVYEAQPTQAGEGEPNAFAPGPARTSQAFDQLYASLDDPQPAEVPGQPADLEAQPGDVPADGQPPQPAEAAAPRPSAATPAPAPAPAPEEPAVPEWFANAQRKARRTDDGASTAHRSRYADALDAAVAESSAHFERANRVIVDETAQFTEARMRGSIVEVEPPEDYVAGAPVASDSQPASHGRGVDAIFEGSTQAAFAAPADPVFAAPAPAPAPAAAPADATTAIDPVNVDDLRSQLAQDAARLQAQPSLDVQPADRIAGARVVYDEQGQATQITAEEAAAMAPPHAQVTLPEPDQATEMLPAVDSLKQRAPLADAAEADPADPRTQLSSRLPRIEDASTGGAAIPDNKLAALRATLPSMSGTISAITPPPENTAVSPAGSFNVASATGSFAPITDELVADVAPEDRYIEDADDSAYEEATTATGAYAGPGYMEMPKQRFSLFGRKKAKRAEPSTADWIGVDESYDARSVGAARGSWESFQGESGYAEGVASGYQDVYPEGQPAARGQRDSAGFGKPFSGYTYEEYDEDDWSGGAMQRERGMYDSRPLTNDELAVPRPSRAALEFATVADLAAQKAQVDGQAQLIEEELQQVYDFHAQGLNVEVWFVALGSEYAGNGGMKAFLTNHASELRGSIVINLEALGAGELSHVEQDGIGLPAKPASRVKRYLRSASISTGRNLQGVSQLWRNSAATVAIRSGLQALTLCGADDRGKPAYMAQGDDVLENLDAQTLDQNIEYVFDFIKNI